MNFLGHLLLSPNDPEIQIANLYGDFVKGSDLSEFPEKVQQGIRLHREIDQYIDHHPAVLKLLHSLYEELPKVSGIATDLYFDHLIAVNWDKFYPTDLRSFTQSVYLNFENIPEFYSLDFRYVISKMAHEDWLYQYRDYHGLEMACNGLSRRIRFENVLYKAPAIFLKQKELIEETFWLYITDAMNHFHVDHLR